MQKRDGKTGRNVSPGRGAAGPAAGTSGRARKPSDSSGGSSSSSSSGGKYRYCVLSGNESVLLKEALQRRPWWEPAPENSDRWNLWAGLNGQKFDQYDLLSPLPAVSTRAPLPITASTLIASKASTAPTATAATAAPAARSASGAAASSSGRGAGGGGAAGAAAADPRQRRCVNRLPEHRVLCTKSGLAGVLATLVQAQGQGQGQGLGSAAGRSASAGAASAEGGGGGGGAAGAGSLSWIPETYVVAAGPKAPAASPALSRFKSAFAKHAAAGRRVWIAKPTSLNRGNGIEVFDSLDRILDHIKTRPAGSNLILQKYIENPLLLGGRKFDIRAYVLVGPPQLAAAAAPADAGGGGDGGGASGAAAAAPYAEAAPVWFHREAYVRTSSTPYDAADLGNRSAHLTNDAVQKTLDTYHAFEDHCKLSLAQLGPELIRQASHGPPAAAAAPAAPAASTPSAAPAPAPAPAASTPSAAAAPAAPAASTPSAAAAPAAPAASTPSAMPAPAAPAPAASTPSAAPAPAPAPAPVQPVPVPSVPSVPSVPVPVLDTAPGSEAGLWGRMRGCVAALLGASAHLLNPRRLGGCWELLGLDFMLDDAGGLYLIEVNTSPALFRAGAYLSDLLPRLVEEVVQRAVDPLFPPLPPPPPPAAAGAAAEAAAETAAKAAEAAAVAGPAAGAGEVAAGERDAAAGASSGGTGGGGRGGGGSSTITPLDGFVRVELLPLPAPGTARGAGVKGNGAAKSGAATAMAKGAGGGAVGGTAAAGRQLASSSSGAARGSAAGGGSSNCRAAQNGSSKAAAGRVSPGRVYAAGTAGAGASARRK